MLRSTFAVRSCWARSYCGFDFKRLAVACHFVTSQAMDIRRFRLIDYGQFLKHLLHCT